MTQPAPQTPIRRNAIRRQRRIRQFAIAPYEDSIQPRNLLPLLLEVASERLSHEALSETVCLCDCNGCKTEGWWID